MTKRLLIGFALSLIWMMSHAQINGCSSPANLVKNGNFSLGNNGDFTSALPLNTGCAGQSYMVGNNLNSKCSGWPNCPDHTFPVVNPGNLLIIDGSTLNPADVWTETVCVTQGVTYTFSFWTAAVSTTQAFDLAMVINGVPTYTCTNIPLGGVGIWKQYTSTWTSGVTGTIPIAIRQLTGGGYRDFGVDDIFFGYCSGPIAISPNSTICAGSSVTLNAAYGGATSYVWNTGATTSSIVVSPVVTTTYIVTASTSTCDVRGGTVIVTVNPQPSVSVSSQTICQGQTAILRAVATGATSYVWSTGATTSSITVSPGVTSTYTVTVTNSYGCRNKAMATVTVNPIPFVPINAPVICSGDPATLIAGGGGTYLWSTGATTPSIVVSPPQTTSYMVTVTNAYGCSTTAYTTVQVSPRPIADAGPDLAICSSSPRFIGPGTTAAVSYSWAPASGLSASTAKNPAASPSVTTTYTLTVTDNMSGCTATDMVTVFVLPTSCQPQRSTCEGSATSVPIGDGLPGVVYTWGVTSGSTGTISCGNDPYCAHPTATAGTYDCMWQLSYTDANGHPAGCVVSCQGYWTVCPNDPGFSVTTSSIPGNNYFNITATPNVDPTSPAAVNCGLGFYWDIMEVDAYGNPVPGTEIANPSSWWSAPLATVNTFAGYDFNTTYGTNNSGFTGGSTPGKFHAGHYYKIKRGTWSSTCPWQESTVIVTACGSGVCRMANGGNPVHLKSSETNTTLSEEEIERIEYDFSRRTPGNAVSAGAANNSGLAVYPNPSNGSFTIWMQSENEKDIFIYDAMGKQVFEKTRTKEQTLPVDMKDLPKGIYMIKVLDGDDEQVQKVIVQ